ncbi:hypothetical protein KCU88_g305, partial [Aureobasidium melanogenum]
MSLMSHFGEEDSVLLDYGSLLGYSTSHFGGKPLTPYVDVTGYTESLLPAMPPRPLQAEMAAATVARFHCPTTLLAWKSQHAETNNQSDTVEDDDWCANSVRPGYMPAIEMPSRTLNAIISLQLVMAAVHMVIKPNAQVIVEKNILGPTSRNKIVAGSWKHTEATVKMNMETEYLSPLRSRSDSMLVTDADEMMPLSSRFKLQRTPAIPVDRDCG